MLLSSGNSFSLSPLQVCEQLRPLNKTVVSGFNQDGHLYIAGAGANFGAEVETIRYESRREALLLRDGNGNFTQQAPNESGFFVNVDATDIVRKETQIFNCTNSWACAILMQNSLRRE